MTMSRAINAATRAATQCAHFFAIMTPVRARMGTVTQAVVHRATQFSNQQIQEHSR